jgi:predicted phage terminase large subunit-like protein
LLEEQNRRWERERLESRLAAFIWEAWPVLEPGRKLKWNWHIDAICAYLEAFERREFNRLIISVPPRCMKSLCVSVFYPAWKWARTPAHQFLSLSHNQDLALRDAVKTRLLVESEWYQNLWGDKVQISKDQNEKKYYSNTANGHRNAQGIGAGLTGKGGDDILIDDAHDAEKAQSDVERQNTLDAYDHKVVTRLNDQVTGGICIIQQRLHEQDLVGHVKKKEKQEWVELVIPMEYDGERYRSRVGEQHNDPRTELGQLLWEERFPRGPVEALKEDLGEYGTAGQFQQRPTPAGGGILKKHWWREWPEDQPLPVCDHIFESWDTAYSEEGLEDNSYSARIEWGVFWHEPLQRYCLLMLDAWDGRVDYPDLREQAQRVEKERKPDRHLIEKKASGQSLIQDLRRAGVPVYRYNPDRDKVARAYAVQAMLQSGQVWYIKRKWALRVIDMVAAFPNGAPPSKDYTDVFTQALLYLRNGWWVEHPDDPEDEEPPRDNERRLYG